MYIGLTALQEDKVFVQGHHKTEASFAESGLNLRIGFFSTLAAICCRIPV